MSPIHAAAYFDAYDDVNCAGVQTLSLLNVSLHLSDPDNVLKKRKRKNLDFEHFLRDVPFQSVGPPSTSEYPRPFPVPIPCTSTTCLPRQYFLPHYTQLLSCYGVNRFSFLLQKILRLLLLEDFFNRNRFASWNELATQITFSSNQR